MTYFKWSSKSKKKMEKEIRCPECNAYIHLEWRQNKIKEMQLKELTFRAKCIEQLEKEKEVLIETIRSFMMLLEIQEKNKNL